MERVPFSQADASRPGRGTGTGGGAGPVRLPRDIHEELLFHGIAADVWMQDGVTEQNLRANMAGFYRREDPDGELALVLGAGNVSAIVPLDILDRMINCGEVVICKMNPVNEYLGPIFEDIFAQLVRTGTWPLLTAAPMWVSTRPVMTRCRPSTSPAARIHTT